MASSYSLAIEDDNTVIDYPIDQSFDLDEFLPTITTTNTLSTAADEGQQKIQATERSCQLVVVSKSPTVADAEGICTVCMETFQQSFPGNKQIPCGHVFHSTCISTWISISNSCPVCRRGLTA